MSKENQENFPNTKIKITKIVKEDSIRSASSLFNLSVTQRIMASPQSDTDTHLDKKEELETEQSTSFGCTSSVIAIARQNNLAVAESHYANLLQNIKILDVMYDRRQNMPTTMTSLPSIPLNDLREMRKNFVELPGTHTSSTATEDFVTTISACSQTVDNAYDSRLAMSSSTEHVTMENVSQLKLSEGLEVTVQEKPVQINLEQHAEVLLNRNSSDFIPHVPEIITDAIEIEVERPSLWFRIKAGCITVCNMVGDFLCHNKDFFICLAFFGGFIVCTAFLTAFFYEILTIDPEHMLYPTINDKVYFSDRQSKY